jgi:hypothetical protein
MTQRFITASEYLLSRCFVARPALPQVLKGAIDFKSEPWPKISEAAKDCVKKLLEMDPAKRATSEQVGCAACFCELVPTQHASAHGLVGCWRWTRAKRATSEQVGRAAWFMWSSAKSHACVQGWVGCWRWTRPSAQSGIMQCAPAKRATSEQVGCTACLL